MIEHLSLRECGPLRALDWATSPRINLILGPNGSGKSIILKMLYASVRALEAYRRGNDTEPFVALLSRKLLWTFQVERLGDLVRKEGQRLSCELRFDDQTLAFGFSARAERLPKLQSEGITPRHRDGRSLFLPPKEILSLIPVILKSRLVDQMFGFDDTYLDLALAVEAEPVRGRRPKPLEASRERLDALIGGRLELFHKGGRKEWFFRQGRYRYPIRITAEGTKRLAILDRLVSNRQLDAGSILFIDEPEAMLHPSAIVRFMEVLRLLAEAHIQVFLASHSYFVLKALYLLARQHGTEVQVLSLNEDGLHHTVGDLRQGMLDNPILDEAIALYEREVDLTLGDLDGED